MPDKLSIWTVYENPKDFPGLFVARRWVGLKPTTDFFAHTELEPVRDFLRGLGLTCLERHPSDDPCILETWL